MRASIIIPSYNAKERLRLNLLALDYQDYKKKDVEVIVVDNGSTDGTMEMLEGISLKLPHKYLRIEENRGIANGRNRGILEASGDILIFHDSDMIAEKSFIKKHLKAHTHDNMVVCGLPWKRIYTHFYEKFDAEQVADFETHIGRGKDSFLDKEQVMADSMIENNGFLESAFDLQSGFIEGLKGILAQGGGDISRYGFPWRFFITNNLSVGRKRVLELGMFDANIVKYGFEDYDMGFRLYKTGSQFVAQSDIISVHQEHPKAFNYHDVMENIDYICRKYNNILYMDILLVCLAAELFMDEAGMNLVLDDINSMLGIGGFEFVLQLFLNLIQLIHSTSYQISVSQMQEMYALIVTNRKEITDQLSKLITIYGRISFARQLSTMVKRLFDIDLNLIG